jgi:hypothetical protein
VKENHKRAFELISKLEDPDAYGTMLNVPNDHPTLKEIRLLLTGSEKLARKTYTKREVYHVRVTTPNGEIWYFHGFKKMNGFIKGFQRLYMKRDMDGYHLERGEWFPYDVEPGAIVKN